MPRYQHSGAAVTTRLLTAMTPGGPPTISVESTTNWPSQDFWIVIDRGTTSEEKVLVGSRTSNSLSSLQRGGDGGSAVSHPVGATVEHVFTGLEADQANEHVNSTIGVHGLPNGDSVAGQSHVFAHAQLTTNAHGATPPAAVMVVVPGMMVDWAGGAAPSGWLVCDGSAVSRTTYSDLFARIGTTWGAGDGSTTFNLPGRSADWFARYGTPGDAGGADVDSVGLSTANLPPHTHTSAEHAHSTPSHTHSIGHDHPAGTTSSDTHEHTLRYAASTGVQMAGLPSGNGQDGRTNMQAIDTDTHSHTFDVAAYTGQSGAAGASNTGATTPGPTGSTGSGTPLSIDTVPVYSGLQKIIYAGV